ncbi:MAG TPA: NAD(P)/FAD-dependent oxidoreductase [Solirubrobacterales bacterium]|nr:NAD(P)/FAD-dependent oxidoreductase [Solirubrobacterales bacterium]
MARNGTSNGSAPTPRIVIVGAGFGGIGLAIRLKQSGIDSFTILEKGDGVGGVWHDNSYPGLTCDIPSHLYSFSFEPKHDWSRRFPPREEILEYLHRCIRKHGVEDHLQLGTEVAAADFDEPAGVWRLRTADGERIDAEVLVAATGQLSRPAYPALPGLEGFSGPVFHSARWDHDLDLTGRRVAVIGTGASAIQFVPEIAPRVERLHLFQRSAPWVVRKPDRLYGSRERRLYQRLPAVQRLSRAWDYLFYETFVLAFTRLRVLMRPFELLTRRRLRSEVPDPELQAKLEPDYPMGCKRILLSDDWYASLQRTNVEVVSERISSIEPDRIVADGGVERPVDAIIMATGFRATEFLSPMAISGLGGRDLNEAWRDGPEAYLGLTVSGFPNMFILYGPNTNLGVGSVLYMLESQIRYVIDSIRKLRATGARYIDLRPEVQRAFNAELQRRLRDSVWATGCASWYRTESGRVTNNWPGLTLDYRVRTRHLELADYRVAGTG